MGVFLSHSVAVCSAVVSATCVRLRVAFIAFGVVFVHAVFSATVCVLFVHAVVSALCVLFVLAVFSAS